MKHRSVVALAALTSIAAGCGGLRLTLVDSAYQRPSNVAVYFAVDTAGGEPVGGLAATDFRIYEDDALLSHREPADDRQPRGRRSTTPCCSST